MPRSKAEAAWSSGRILHVGGSRADRALLRAVLEDDGHQVLCAESARAGIDLAAEVRPDLVLLDLELPEEEGYAVALRLRSHPELQATRLVILGPSEERERALALGCDNFLERPLEAARLSERVRDFLRGKRERVRGAVERRHLRQYSEALVGKLETKVRELTLANERLSQLDEIKNHILENVSHEFATPLTPMMGYLELLESGRLGPVTPRQRKAVAGLSHGLRRLARTVDGLLDLASLEEVGAPLETASFDLEQAAREAVQVVRSKARAQRVEVEVTAPERVAAAGEPAKVRQALVHLVGNAVRFSPRGGHVLVQVQRKDGRARAQVFDQGLPIPAEEQERVFELFHAPGRRGTQSDPMGNLALAVARRIAETHGGRLTVESPPRSQPNSEHHYPGARFLLELPAARAE